MRSLNDIYCDAYCIFQSTFQVLPDFILWERSIFHIISMFNRQSNWIAWLVSSWGRARTKSITSSPPKLYLCCHGSSLILDRVFTQVTRCLLRQQSREQQGTKLGAIMSSFLNLPMSVAFKHWLRPTVRMYFTLWSNTLIHCIMLLKLFLEKYLWA